MFINAKLLISRGLALFVIISFRYRRFHCTWFVRKQQCVQPSPCIERPLLHFLCFKNIIPTGNLATQNLFLLYVLRFCWPSNVKLTKINMFVLHILSALYCALYEQNNGCHYQSMGTVLPPTSQEANVSLCVNIATLLNYVLIECMSSYIVSEFPTESLASCSQWKWILRAGYAINTGKFRCCVFQIKRISETRAVGRNINYNLQVRECMCVSMFVITRNNVRQLQL